MRFLVWLSVFVFASCSVQKAEPPVTGETRHSLVGVPVNGYPNYDERLQLVAQNRARSDPNYTDPTDPDLDTWAACSVFRNPQPPLDYHLDLAEAARFHCAHSMLNDGGLTHDSYCELRDDVEGCDGSSACSCVATTECWSCMTLGGCGTDPFTRMSYFGFTGNAENGAAGYADSWAAIRGWITECAGNDGHRINVTRPGSNVVGTGSIEAPGGCYSGFFFSDYGNVPALAIPRIPSGVHRPETGSTSTTFSLYANWYDPGGDPQSIDVVIDGVCTPMAVEIGTDVGHRTYLHQGTLPDGCREYYVLARDSGGTRVTYPEVGSLLVEVGGGTCADDYAGTQLPASCEAVIDGGVAPDLGVPDSGPSPDSASTPDQGAALDSGTAVDAGSTPDSTASTDAPISPDAAMADEGSAGPDESVPTTEDDEGVPTANDGAVAEGDGGEEAEIDAGCSCAVGSRSEAGGGSVALGLLVLLWARWRRSANPRRCFAAPGVAPCATRYRTP